jgi:hypothetical protein
LNGLLIIGVFGNVFVTGATELFLDSSALTGALRTS